MRDPLREAQPSYSSFDNATASVESFDRSRRALQTTRGWSLGLRLESLTSTATNVPEPATAMLLMLGLTGCWVARRQRV